MRTPAAIADELRALDAALHVFESDSPASTPGADIMEQTLTLRRSRLLEELRLASIGRERPALTFMIDGPPALQHALSARLAGSILIEIQELVTTAGQALTGNPTTRGSVARETMGLTELGVAGVVFGSFGFVLQGQPYLIQLQLFDIPEPSIIEQALVRLVDTIEASISSAETFLDSVAELGQRFAGHLNRFAELVANSKANTEFIIEGPLVERRILDAGSSDFASLCESLGNLRTTVDVQPMTGELLGALTLSGRFEFQRDDGVVLRGRVDPSLREKLAEYFLGHCKVDIEITRTSAESTGKTGYSYRMVDVYEG